MSKDQAVFNMRIDRDLKERFETFRAKPVCQPHCNAG